MFKNKEKNFILQQGFNESCSARYGALQFQPRVVFTIFLAGLVFQSAWIFLVLAILLGVSAWKPEKNPFELLYNRTLGQRPGAEQLGVAPAPRLFSQKMAAVITLLISLCLFFNRPLWAYLLELVMFGALVALVTTGFCVGSVVYWVRQHRADFVKQTLPWS